MTEEKIEFDLGSRIKKIRGSLSQQEFADKIGAKQSSIAGWENQEKAPGSKYLEAIKNEFGVSIDWLLTGEGAIYTKEIKNIEDNQIDIKRFVWFEQILNKYFQEFIKVTKSPEFQKQMTLGMITGLLGAGTQKIEKTETPLDKDIERPLPESTQASILLVNILNSGDQVIIQALMSNLLAFNRSVEKDQKQSTRIQELEEKCRLLEQRLENIEKRHELTQSEPELKKGAA